MTDKDLPEYGPGQWSYLDATPGDTCSGGYVPDREAFEYGCYEADRTQLQPGSAEELADRYVEMLKELKAEY